MNEQISSIKEKVSNTFELLSQLNVAGDAVDVMYAARMQLRAAYEALEQLEMSAASEEGEEEE